VTVELYAANVALISASLFLMWLHVNRKRALLHAGITIQRVQHGLWGAALTALVFLASIVVAQFSAEVALWMWLLIIPAMLAGPRAHP
jgi:hypothetical protein